MADNYNIGFIIEQALGHITHGENLAVNIELDQQINPFWGFPKQPQDGFMALPGVRNWTLQAGLQSNQALRQLDKESGGLDAIFFHTQVTAILAQRWLKQIPSIVSLDATPLQYDSLGEFYAHESGPSWLESFKFNKNQRCYQLAKKLVTWSDWAKNSLIKDYGIDEQKIVTIAPGVNVSEWNPPKLAQNKTDDTVKILFVGGDLKRKGGEDLINAFTSLQTEMTEQKIELHLVTKGQPKPIDSLFVYNNMRPNSDELKALYHQADIFCLPTYGDCLPMVLSEAAATELPIISTSIAAIPEVVKEGEGGLLVSPGSVAQLKDALKHLITHASVRQEMGLAALNMTKQHFDAQKNAMKLFELLKETAEVK